jgi:hypothetical protein
MSKLRRCKVQAGEGAHGAQAGNAKCIFCEKDHKTTKEEPLANHTYTRDDDALTSNGRTFIKGDEERSYVYPRDDNGGFVSPLEPPTWDAKTIFKTYKTKKGATRRYAEKYQPPPIVGWIAAPHHMVAICCMNGTNKLPGVPQANPWAHRGNYDISNGGNCIFLPSSASQFYVAYYYWKVRKTGRALQGHLGAHRKVYFETVWDRLEKMVRDLARVGLCEKTENEDDKDAVARKVCAKVDSLQAFLFARLASLRPEEKYKLGAESYIEIPAEDEEFGAPTGLEEQLQPYETLPKWY